MQRIVIWEMHRPSRLAVDLVGLLRPRFSVQRVEGEPAEPWTEDGTVGAVLLVAPSAKETRVEEIVAALRRDRPELPLMLATESGEPGTVSRLLELGVLDFVTPPLRNVELLPRLDRLLGRDHGDAMKISERKARLGLRDLVGESECFLQALEKIPPMARSGATVLIVGETGTGKEVGARAIHRLSRRAAAPFVPVNCGAIPLELVERELFGHERAAFTGASTPGPGLVAEAEGGTLFLDEVDALPPSAQVKLLRFLQEKEYRPLGSTKVRCANVRVIAATNTNVEEAVTAGRLRQDLFYRLAVLPLRLPPLRERRDDILLLARHILARSAARSGRAAPALAPETIPLLYGYDWPGNVRELEHVLERALVFAEDHAVIRRSDIVLDVGNPPQAETFRRAKARVVARFEKSYIENLLAAYRGNITHAAQAARKNRRAFFELIRKHRIDTDRFRAVAAS